MKHIIITLAAIAFLSWPIIERLNDYVSVRQCPVGKCSHAAPGEDCPHGRRHVVFDRVYRPYPEKRMNLGDK